MGATWFRRGSRSSAGHAEGQITSQIQSGNTLNANDERFALAA